jgi:hypothetical protein
VIGRGSVKEGVGIVKALSRRDEMKVARHEMPGNRAPRSPSRRVRHDRLFKASYRFARWTTPYGTDHICHVSRHFMPGYHCLAPPGQIQVRPFVEVREQSEGTRGRTAVTQYSAPQKPRTACPTKPMLYGADRSNRPRKRGTLHNRDAGEVGRTTRTNTNSPVRLTEPVCIGQPQNQGN